VHKNLGGSEKPIQKSRKKINTFTIVKELEKNELMGVDGGELTKTQEVWVERAICFAILGLVGVAIYELGRQNG
jgi:hypothetical protein